MGLISNALNYSSSGKVWFDISIDLNLVQRAYTYSEALQTLYNNYFTKWQNIELGDYSIELGLIFMNWVNYDILQAVSSYGSIYIEKKSIGIQKLHPKEGALSDVTFFTDSAKRVLFATAIIVKTKTNKFIGLKILNHKFIGGNEVIKNSFYVDNKIQYNHYVYMPYTYGYSVQFTWEYKNLYFKPYSGKTENGYPISYQGATDLVANFDSKMVVPYSSSSTVTYDSETKVYTENQNSEAGETVIELNSGYTSILATSLISSLAFDSYQEFLDESINFYKAFTKYTATNYDQESPYSYYTPELDQNIQLLYGLSGTITADPTYTGYF